MIVAQMTLAAVWICPECGARNYAEPLERTREQNMEAHKAAGGGELEPGDTVLTWPTTGVCGNCKLNFRTTFAVEA